VAEKKGKFSALAELHRQPIEEEEETSPPTVSSIAVEPREAGKGRGRPATGKRSHPDWKLQSHYLKRQTHRAVAARLIAADDGRDMSDLLQELLEKWLISQPPM